MVERVKRPLNPLLFFSTNTLIKPHNLSDHELIKNIAHIWQTKKQHQTYHKKILIYQIKQKMLKYQQLDAIYHGMAQKTGTGNGQAINKLMDHYFKSLYPEYRYDIFDLGDSQEESLPAEIKSWISGYTESIKKLEINKARYEKHHALWKEAKPGSYTQHMAERKFQEAKKNIKNLELSIELAQNQVNSHIESLKRQVIKLQEELDALQQH